MAIFDSQHSVYLASNQAEEGAAQEHWSENAAAKIPAQIGPHTRAIFFLIMCRAGLTWPL